MGDVSTDDTSTQRQDPGQRKRRKRGAQPAADRSKAGGGRDAPVRNGAGSVTIREDQADGEGGGGRRFAFDADGRTHQLNGIRWIDDPAPIGGFPKRREALRGSW